MDLNKVEILPPFKNFLATVGNIPSSYQESMTYYEMLQWFCNYLENTVIPTLNNNGQSVIELQNLFTQLHDYVEKYFNDLDVQQEINNKLDTMASDGTLNELLLPYFNTYKNEINQEITNQNNRIDLINTKVDSVANGTPLVASSTQEMTETSKIYVNTNDNKWYYYNGVSWVIGGDYLSNPTQDYIINFINNIQSINSENIISNLIHYKFINPSNGNESDYSSFGYATDFIEIKIPNVKMRLDSINTKIIETSGNFGMAFYDDNKNYISGIKYSNSESHTSSSIDFIPPPKTKYVRFSIRNLPSTLNLFILSAFDIYNSIINYIDVKTLLLDDFKNINITKNFLTGYNISYINGSYTNTSRTDVSASDEFIEILPCAFTLESLNPRAFDGNDSRGLAFYDSNKQYISGIQYNNNGNKLIISNVPKKAQFIRCSISHPSLTPENSLSITYNNIYNLIYDLFNKTKNIDTIKQDYLSSFLNVGVIGDSFASGSCGVDNNGTTEIIEFKEHSWPQYLARKIGTNFINYTKGGFTAHKFVTNSEYGLLKIIEDASINPCELYLIGLGINDSWAPNSLGTIDDISTNNDTFYGNYSKIIDTIKNLHPKAIIICMTIPVVSPATNRNDFNTAIRNIYEHYSNNNVYLIDCANINDYDSILRSHYRNGHLNALGYALSADIIHNAINQIIEENISNFNNIEIINTDYELPQP